MVNKVLRVGDSAAVTIPKKTLQELGVKIGDQVVVTFEVNEHQVTIRPLKEKKHTIQNRIARLTANFIDRYRPALEKLSE